MKILPKQLLYTLLQHHKSRWRRDLMDNVFFYGSEWNCDFFASINPVWSSWGTAPSEHIKTSPQHTGSIKTAAILAVIKSKWYGPERCETSLAYLDVSWLFLQDEIGDFFRNLQRKRQKQISQSGFAMIFSRRRKNNNEWKAYSSSNTFHRHMRRHVHFGYGEKITTQFSWMWFLRKIKWNHSSDRDTDWLLWTAYFRQEWRLKKRKNWLLGCFHPNFIIATANMSLVWKCWLKLSGREQRKKCFWHF